MPSEMTFRIAFGSWGNAVKEAGFMIKKPYPSKKCLEAVSKVKRGKIRESSSNWKGGKRISEHGYILLWNSQKSRYEPEHRHIMERHLNRKLLPYEEVHHKNKLKTDNRIENLMLLNKSAHAKIHAHDPKITKRIKSQCIYPDCDILTTSKFGLCKEHYKKQWQRLKNGLIYDMFDIKEISRKHSDKTKKILSDLAKKQYRKNGRFSIHDNPALLKGVEAE